MEIQLDGKVALVTGGSSGIGKSIAQALKACGAKVAVNYLGKQGNDPTIERLILESGSGAIAIQANISDQKQVAAMFAKIDAELGEIDILVNCAGTDGNAALSWNAEVQAWKSNIDINLPGALYCAQHALARMMEKKSGVILNISSVHEFMELTADGTLAGNKAALSRLTRTMAEEVAPMGIRVLALAPGIVTTAPSGLPQNDLDGLASRGVRRLRSGAGEMGRFAASLVSDFAPYPYVSGSTIFADGGMMDYAGYAQR